MKKLLTVIIAIVYAFTLSQPVFAAEVLSYDFENDSLEVVTNTLKSGGTARFEESSYGKALALDGTYGVKLGAVGNTFTVMAMVNVSSTGGTDTLFFKDMDGVGNIWTGVISNGSKPAFWTHGDGYAWTTVATGSVNINQWSHVAYVENNGNGSLYVNGELIGSGGVAKGNGTLYLGATYWSADAVKGLCDNVKLCNNALSADEIMAEYEQYVDFESVITLPKEVIGDIALVNRIASKTVTWKSSNESVIDTEGKVTRGDEDEKVTLIASIDAEVIGTFEVTVLKKPVSVNKKVILSYKFDENDGEIIHDSSGNGNHGAAYNGLVIDDGAVFDGVDDYIKMPEAVLYGHDNITIVMTMTPHFAQQHVFAYCFGNGSDSGYMFLNPSRPDTNYLRFAMTKNGHGDEKEMISLPGVRNGEETTIAVVINGEEGLMYVDGHLVMDAELGMTVSDMGKTLYNYIGKSLYDGDPYFKGVVKEFTVYDHCLTEAEILSRYKKEIEYAPEKVSEEYITAVSFENGIEVEADTLGRDDVKIAALCLDENNGIIDFSVVSYGEEITVSEEGTVVVFAFNEEDNIPGKLYVKGVGEGFSYEYTPGNIRVISDKDYSNGMVIVAGYDMAGTLTGVAFKLCDLTSGEAVDITGDFDDAVSFKLLYWENLVSMIPTE